MGKAQSKRSVDITTEANKEGNASNETAGKVEKIEDADQLKANQVNGDASQPATEVIYIFMIRKMSASVFFFSFFIFLALLGQLKFLSIRFHFYYLCVTIFCGSES